MLAHRERTHAVDSYTTPESDRLRGTTRLLLSTSEKRSLVLTVMGHINTPSQWKTKKQLITIRMVLRAGEDFAMVNDVLFIEGAH